MDSKKKRSLMRPGRSSTLAAIMTAGLLAGGALTAKESPSATTDVDEVFEREVQPVLERYCSSCHGEKKQKADIRFDQVDPDMVDGLDAEIWSFARDMLNSGDMPPKKSPQPSAEERKAVVSWLNASLEEAARAHEGKRQSVLRRLNKAQYTNSLQDLLGLTIDFGQVLPDDGKSKMGFTNNGEVLLASPLHLEYHQEIARAGLDQAIVIGEQPEPTRYKLQFGKGRGMGLPSATTGGYQAVPLNVNDFTVDILDSEGATKVGSNPEEQGELDRVKRKVTVGFRGSSQDRFHTVEEGIVLYSSLPHKEVAPGSWQGPSPNMKLEMQRVFPDEGDFALRVTASRGYLVKKKKELLISFEDPSPRATLTPGEPGEEPSPTQALKMKSHLHGDRRSGPGHGLCGPDCAARF